MSWTSQKRVILPFLQRAQEIDSANKKVAYYCRLYAVDQGIRIDKRVAAADELLGEVLTQLQRDKPAVTIDPGRDKEECESFALKVFRIAKERDDEGYADRETARAYQAASTFLEILRHFGQPCQDIEQKRWFAISRSAEIMKSVENPDMVLGETEHREEIYYKDIEEPQSSASSSRDPGYQPGCKVWYSEDAICKIAGVIKRKQAGFFEIQNVEDGSSIFVILDQLAPDLPLNSRVKYWKTSEEDPLEAKVLQVEYSKWPPLYLLEFPDGTQRNVPPSFLKLVPQVSKKGPLALVRRDSRRSKSSVDLSTKSSASTPTSCSPRTFNLRGPSDGMGADSKMLKYPESDQQGPNGDRSATYTGDKAPFQPISEPEAFDINNQPDGPQPEAYVPTSSIPDSESNDSLTGSENQLSPLSGFAADPVVQTSPLQPSTPAKIAPEQHLHVSVPPQISSNHSKDCENEGAYTPDVKSIEKAKKFSRFAASSLGFDDVDEAVKYLKDALRLLTQSENN